MIETRLLQQFIAVAEELHFNRAAERLHMAQPPLSQAIRRLEEEIGYPLFDRTNRSVSLTPAGAAFLDTARRIVSTLDDGVAHTRRVAQGVDGHLTMTFIDISRYAELLRALRGFHAAFPAVTFTMREATTQEQVRALEAGSADLGFMRRPGVTTPRLRFATVLRESIVVALPAGHPLQADEAVELAMLRDESFVASHRSLGQGFHDQLVALCQAAGFVPRIVQSARQLPTLVALVASGFGVALLPDSVARQQRGDVVFRPIAVDAPADLLHLDLLMAWDETRDSAIRDRFIDEIRKAIPLSARD